MAKLPLTRDGMHCVNVFISHSDDDREFVAELYQQLKSWGHKIWVEQETMPRSSVNRAVEWADITLGILTNQTVRNQQVLSAWRKTLVYGELSNKRLVILKRDNAKLPTSFMDINIIDMKADNKTGITDLKASLSQSDFDMWAPTQPIPLDDPYLDYLMHLYDTLEGELDFLLHSTGLRADGGSEKPILRRSFSDMTGTLENFQTGFENHNHRLVLLANEGTGKTVTLLSFVRDAVLARLNDPHCPIPIYAQIRRWNVQKTPKLEYWLAAQCQLDPDSIRELIATGEALLVLDGLDELAKKHSKDDNSLDPRLQFMDMLPNTCPIVLSSRSDDFAELGTHNKLNATITLHPLTDEQIQEYLEFNPASTALWQSLLQNPILLEVIRTPLLLTMFAFAFSNMPDEANQLVGKSEGELRDTLFESYVTRRYQQEKAHYGGQAPFPLQQIFMILGLVATRGVIRYGTGRVAMVQVNQPQWDDLLIIDDLRFGFMDDDSPYGAEFLGFAHQLHLITCPEDGIGSCSFMHTMIRDLLVIKHCLPIAQKLDSYTIESLTRISDQRKYAAFAEVLTGDYTLNYKLQAFAALENDKSDMALRTLMSLSETFQHEFFTERIRESIERRVTTN